MPKTADVRALANRIKDEIASDAKALAPAMWQEVVADTLKMPRSKYVDWVRRHWLADPANFPKELLERLAPEGPHGLRPLSGVKSFLALVEDVFVRRPDRPDETPMSGGYEQLAADVLGRAAQMDMPPPAAAPGNAVLHGGMIGG